MSMKDVLSSVKSINARYSMFHAFTEDEEPGDAKFLFSVLPPVFAEN